MLSEKVLLAEFGNSYIRLALACGRPGAYKILACEKLDAPVYAGEITDPDLMRELISGYLKKNRIKKCRVRIVLHHPHGMMRFMKLPKMRASDLDKAVRAGFGELFPPDGGAYVFDYRVNFDSFGGAAAIVSGLPESVSTSYTDFFEGLGLKPVSLDTYANAASVYLESNQSGNFAAVFENPYSVNILRFVDGRLVASRDIRYDTETFAASEIRNYMRLYPGVSEKIFMFTDLKIADDIFLDMKTEVYKATVQFMAFYGLFGNRKD